MENTGSELPKPCATLPKTCTFRLSAWPTSTSARRAPQAMPSTELSRILAATGGPTAHGRRPSADTWLLAESDGGPCAPAQLGASAPPRPFAVFRILLERYATEFGGANLRSYVILDCATPVSDLLEVDAAGEEAALVDPPENGRTQLFELVALFRNGGKDLGSAPAVMVSGLFARPISTAKLWPQRPEATKPAEVMLGYSTGTKRF